MSPPSGYQTQARRISRLYSLITLSRVKQRSPTSLEQSKSYSPSEKLSQESFDKTGGARIRKISRLFNENMSLTSTDQQELDVMTKNILRNASPADRIPPGFTSRLDRKHLGGGHKDVLSKLTDAI